MDTTSELDDGKVQNSSQARAPYVRPEVRLLGDVTELTRGAAGSVADGFGGAQGSSIRLKKDVAYLDEAGRARVAEDVLSMRLANWEYIEPKLSGQRHLGIIIEDNPEIAAVNPGKESVDLYSYASMAIAAVQVQAREIAALRAEVLALRSDLAAFKKS